jgi:mycothiol synthase
MTKSTRQEINKKQIELNGYKRQEGEAMNKLWQIEQTNIRFEDQFIVRPAAMADLEQAVELFNTCSVAMIGVHDARLEDIRNEWLLPHFDLDRATRLVFTPEGKLVGYIEVWDDRDPPVKIWVWGRVHPDFEGLGIGTYQMTWAEARARQALSRVPNDLQVVMEAGTPHGYGAAHELLRGYGMEPIRSFYTMAIELNGRPPEAEWPGGIQVRSMTDLGELRPVIHAVRDAFRDHWGFVEQPFEQEYEHWRHFADHSSDFDPGLWFLAMDGDEIAGMSLCWPSSNEDPKMGWVGTLGVRRPWRKQGLGLALLHHSFAEFHQRGRARVGLGVDASSLTGATRLYERAGMRPIRQFDTYRKILRPGKDISTQAV